ncbi:transcriptional regulator, TraR/DksA family [Gracilibacillus ureilyticus]|uniref:Transcriptional regulator, TraR/DksA family n=1 Tax=Gracilibacillus ureilyticus TaxID=531814 RepID=A0A1H9NNW1_9BACI|nr:TraR/DksA C4-type zinc finger protein [Gracilibacillus ureilyticus]SER37571.1 transcriptional regulator, TraR/DksA family [Gracilibacillus ureilyticus]
MDQEIIDRCRNILTERKEEIIQKNEESALALDEEVGELTTFNNHPADLGTELYERERDFTLESYREQELEEINRALEAMDEGTYHLCVECGKQIEEERLLAVPTTRYCIQHAERRN